MQSQMHLLHPHWLLHSVHKAIDRGHMNVCFHIASILNPSLQRIHWFNSNSVQPTSWHGRIISPQSWREKKSLICIFSYSPPLESSWFFEVRACIKSLDLYFLKFITYFLVVCMSCIFNKPFELTVMCCRREHQRDLSLCLPFSLSRSLAFSSRLPPFTVWAVSSEAFYTCTIVGKR